MGALADLSDVINRCTGGSSGTPENIFTFQDARVGAAAASATIAGRLTSLWQYNGQPSGGAAPGGTARNPTRATAGALGQANPGGGRQKWLLGITATALNAGTLLVYDRLADFSGLSGTVTSAQNTTSLAVSRYTGSASVGNQIQIEIYTQIGATGTTILATYTNQAGAGSHTTPLVSIGATNLREAQRVISLPLASGDTGVQSVESVTLTATTGTAGDFGVSIVRPIAVLPCLFAGVGSLRNFITDLPGPIEIMTDAALFCCWLPSSTTAPQIYASYHMIEA